MNIKCRMLLLAFAGMIAGHSCHRDINAQIHEQAKTATEATPTTESLELRLKELLAAAYSGDDRKVAEYFPGGKRPGGERYSWNRYSIERLTVSSRPSDGQVFIVFSRVSGMIGYTVFNYNTKKRVFTGHERTGTALCWRWVNGSWYVVEDDAQCLNPDPSEKARFQEYLKSLDGLPCSEEARLDIESRLKAFLENAIHKEWIKNETYLSTFAYYQHIHSSWSCKRYLEMELERFACQTFAGIKSYQPTFIMTCQDGVIPLDGKILDSASKIERSVGSSVWKAEVTWQDNDSKVNVNTLWWIKEGDHWVIAP